MPTIDVIKAVTSGPNDVSLLKQLADRGHSLLDVIALVAKTEGNGCVNDFSRTLAAVAWGQVLPESAITIFSGGTEGVLSPHAALLVATNDGPGPTGALVAAVGRTAPIPSEQVGRYPQLAAVASVVEELCAELQLTRDDVHLVLVKCPLLTSEQVHHCLAAEIEPATRDTYTSMALSRGASALGVALGLGECGEDDAVATLRGERRTWSSVASVSSGAELQDCKVLVVGASATATGPLRAVHGVMRDALDSETVLDLLGQVAAADGQIVQVLAKAEADPSGQIRGRRHTMLTDSDLSATRHARAAVGGLLAGLVGDSAIYVSGGAEHQGPPGGGPVTIVYRQAGAV